MGWITQTLNSSLGKKLIMSITGFFLILFLSVHLFGNIFLFFGEEVFNGYVHTLEGPPLNYIVKVIEIVLIIGFIIHIYNGIRLTLENKRSRGRERYAKKAAPPNVTLASRTMFLSASIVFIFLVVHLRNFWYEYKYGIATTGASYYRIVIDTFAIPFYSIIYVIGVILLGFHLYHGFQSAFQTLGLNHKKYTPIIEGLGKLYAIIIAVGFASMPIYFLVISMGGK